MRIGDHGEEVANLQRSFIARGYDLPCFGADGDFGRETAKALADFARDLGVAWSATEPVPESLICALLRPDPGRLDMEGVPLHDLRHDQADPHPKGKRGDDGRTVKRDLATIDAICLHQTAVEFGGHGEALARRALDVACHAMAFRAGFVVLATPPDWYMHHANGLNSRSLGLEVDGNYPGLVDGKTGNGKPATPLTDTVVHAARMGVKALVESGRRAGCPIRYIFAHRQADSWRQADPGEGLWRAVVVEYAVPVLGLETRLCETYRHHKGPRRDGKPVPLAWDLGGSGPY